MRKLRLFPKGSPRSAIESDMLRDDYEGASDYLGSSCTKCVLHKSAPVVCMDADGESGGLLVVGSGPDKAAVRPFGTVQTSIIRQTISAHWGGPVVYDHAVRCAGGSPLVGEGGSYAVACGVNTQAVLDTVAPTKIFLMGPVAVYGYTRRMLDPMTVRRSFIWMPDLKCWAFPMLGCENLHNAHLRRMMVDDIRWAAAFTPPDSVLLAHTAGYCVMVTDDNIDELEAAIGATDLDGEGGGFTLDLETFGVMHNPDYTICSVAICPTSPDATSAWVWGRDQLENPNLRSRLIDILRNRAYRRSAHNAKHEIKAVYLGLGVEPSSWYCTMVAHKLAEVAAYQDLEQVAEKVGLGGHKVAALMALTKANAIVAKAQSTQSPLDDLGGIVPSADVEKQAYSYGLLSPEILYRYDALDTISTARLVSVTEQNLIASGTAYYWNTIARPLLETLARIELTGVLVDRVMINSYEAMLKLKLADYREQLVGHGLAEPGSPKQVGEWLYGHEDEGFLGLKCSSFTDTGKPSTDEKTLTALAGQHPALDVLLAWRAAEKQRSTYATGMRKYIRADGRIHTSYNPSGTITSRIASSSPNLQNIPRPETEIAKIARDIFIASPGCVLFQGDYSQIEYRCAAMLSEDPIMLALFNSGEDFHTLTAKMVYPILFPQGPAWDTLSAADRKTQRTAAKAVNFSCLYGSKAESLAQMLNCSVKKAHALMDAIGGKFVKLTSWINQQLADARRTGETWTYWNGRKAHRISLYDIGDARAFRKYPQRTAEIGSWNGVCQGTAAHYCNASLTAIDKWLRETKKRSRIILTVHDSICLDLYLPELPEVSAKMRDIMEGWPSPGLTMKVDFEIGKSWGSMKPYTMPAPDDLDD